jgi:predicted dehydrogenase
MGRRHVAALRAGGFDVVGICDNNPNVLTSAGEVLSIPTHAQFVKPEQLLRLQPDCVVVATTAPSHCQLTCLAANAGVRYILCEKPMATSLAECDTMIELADHAGAKLAINHQMRFMERFLEPLRIVRSEHFGGLGSMTVVAGNFGLAMNGTHYFEAFRMITGERVSEVTAWLSPIRVPNPRGSSFDDPGGAVRVNTASGKALYLAAGAEHGHGIITTYAGPFGMVVVDELAGELNLSVRTAEDRSLSSTRYATVSVRSTRKISPGDPVLDTQAVLDSLVRGEGFPSGHDGRTAVQVLLAAYVSDEQDHRPVSLEEVDEFSKRQFAWA